MTFSIGAQSDAETATIPGSSIGFVGGVLGAEVSAGGSTDR